MYNFADVASSFVVNSNGLEHILRILISSKDKPDSLREASLHALCAACENNGETIKCVYFHYSFMCEITRLVAVKI